MKVSESNITKEDFWYGKTNWLIKSVSLQVDVQSGLTPTSQNSKFLHPQLEETSEVVYSSLDGKTLV